MATELSKKSEHCNRPKRAGGIQSKSNIKQDERLDKVLSLLEELSEKLDLTFKVNRVLIELVGGVPAGRKMFSNMEIVRLRNEGMKVKDLATLQGISVTAMNRKLKELKDAGVLVSEQSE